MMVFVGMFVAVSVGVTVGLEEGVEVGVAVKSIRGKSSPVTSIPFIIKL